MGQVGDKRSVLRRQSRDTNRNIKRSMYCQNQLTDNLNSVYTVHPKVYYVLKK